MTAAEHATDRAQNSAGGLKNSLMHHPFYPLLKIVSPGVITPKTPHSPGQRLEDVPPLPSPLRHIVAICERAVGQNARLLTVAVLALTTFPVGFLQSGKSSPVPEGYARDALAAGDGVVRS